MASSSKTSALPSSDSTNATTWQNFKRLVSYAKPYKLGFVAAIIGMLGYAGIDVYFLSKLQPLVDEGLAGANANFMKWAPLFIIVAFIVRGIAHFVANYCLAWVGNNVVADLRQKLFEHIMSMPVAFHDQKSTGSLISKITFDTEQVLNSVSKSILTMVQQSAFVIGLLGLMFYMSWQLSLIFLLITPVIAVIVSVVSKRFRKVSKNIQGAMGEVTTAAEQTFNGHKVVLTFGGQQREFARFAKINKHNRQQRMKMQATKSASVPIIQVIASFALAFVFYAISADTLRDNISPGTFVSVITYMTMLLRPLKMLTNVNSEFQQGMAACVSIFSILDHEKEKDYGNKKLDRASGTLSFKHVDFSYENTDSSSDKEHQSKLALSDLTFDLEIIAAAKSAHVMEFAEHMEQGLETNIGENGALLSGGQRQRVAIARALLCDTPFLILDEATSALDTESERHIQDALQTLQQNRTSIVIAHRLSTIENADKIIVMDQGKVVEQGNHQSLLAKQGAYARLHSFQFE